MAEVSVVIAAYNSAWYIRGAVNSVLRQGFRDLEVIVVDDGSTDNTWDLLKDYGPPVKYVYQPNSGTAAARNTGIRESRSKYIAFLDADDIWLPDKLAAQVEVMEKNPDVGVVHTSWLQYLPDGTISPMIKDEVPPEEEAKRLIVANKVCPSSVLMRSECVDQIGVFDSNAIAHEDFEYWLRAVAKGIGFRSIAEPLVVYRVAPGSKTSTLDTSEQTLNDLNRFFDENALPDDIARLRPLAVGRMEMHLAGAFLKRGDTVTSRKHLRAACELLPTDSALTAMIASTIVPHGISGPDVEAIARMTPADVARRVVVAASVFGSIHPEVGALRMVERLYLSLAETCYHCRLLPMAANLSARAAAIGREDRRTALKLWAKSVARRVVKDSTPAPGSDGFDHVRSYIAECESTPPPPKLKAAG